MLKAIFSERYFTGWRLACLICLVLSALVYMPSIPGLYLWDDPLFIGGAALGGARNPADCFHAAFQFLYYRPLTALTLWWEARRYPETPLLFHQTNLLIHVLTVGILLSLFRKTFDSGRVALVGGLLFALHPAHLGTVAYISGRSDSLGTLFVALWSWMLVTAGQVRGAARGGLLWGSVAAYALALGASEQALLLPLALLAMPWPDREPAGRATRAGVLLLCVLCGAGYLVLWNRVVPGALARTPGVSLLSPVDFGAGVYYYAMLLIAPLPGRLLEFGIDGGAHPVTAAIGLAAGACAVWQIRRLRSRAPHASWFLLLACLSLIPVSGLVPLRSPAVMPGSLGMALPGLSALAGWLLVLPRRGMAEAGAGEPGSGIRGPVAGVCLLAYAVLTVWGAGLYRQGERLFTTALRYHPESAVAHYNAGVDAMRRGDRRRVVRELEATLHVLYDSEAWRSPDGATAVADDPELLRRLFALRRQPGRLRPRLVELHCALGNAALEAGQREYAVDQFRVGRALLPNDPTANLCLGACALQDRRYVEAEQNLRAALHAAPQSVGAHSLLAETLKASGRLRESEQELKRCIVLRPHVVRTYLRLADVQRLIGNRQAAEETLREGKRQEALAEQTQPEEHTHEGRSD